MSQIKKKIDDYEDYDTDEEYFLIDEEVRLILPRHIRDIIDRCGDEQ